MQRFLSLKVILAVGFAVLFSAAPAAHADIYQINPLVNDNHAFYGMDDAGTVLFSYLGVIDPGPLGAGACYRFMAPACGTSANGRTVTGVLEPGTPIFDLYATSGANPPQLVDQVSGLVSYFINGTGDIVFDGGTAGKWYEALDLTVAATPEPSTLLLLLTGSLGVAAFAMRRRQLA